MSEILAPDICIVGGGAGGLSLAEGAAAFGLSVVLVEKGAIGGDRLAHAIPSHALLAASRFAASLRAAQDFGIEIQEASLDYAGVRAHVGATVAALAPNYAQERLEALNVTVIRASGRFTRADTLAAGGATIKARHFVIATGAPAKPLAIPGLDLIRPLSYGSACALESPPRRLIVAGADPHGLALAQGLRRLGSEVVILAPEKIFAGEDDELVAPVRTEFAREGIAIHEHVRILKVEPQGEGLCAVIARAAPKPQTETKTIEGSHLLIAAEGAPHVEGLGLKAARVRYDAAGIAVSRTLRTSNRRIYAIGAVARGAAPAGTAEHQASLALRQIRRGPLAPLLGLLAGRIWPGAIAKVFAVDPEIAVAGLSEAEARERRLKIHVLRWPFAETDRARIEARPDGHVKLVTSARGRILGAGIVGPAAGELINLCTLAISKGMSAADLASIMVPYPTLSEAARRAAMASWPSVGAAWTRFVPGLWHRLD
ncbi:dihydrolipoyl dehydrogenase family protein [Methylocapsa aurea]|uniref:dihydrolipoyl dehydrogenase family protein n=1 Tax=Methylocapsa aurea TaxID=663610 RepID=UPI000560FC64|nr:FAD-dependent oxidoreductase [Methylocapsa aurea]